MTLDNTNPAQHVLVPLRRTAIAEARARDTQERGFFCSVYFGAVPGATTNRRLPRLPHPPPLNP
jgi:hypothetical protein